MKEKGHFAIFKGLFSEKCYDHMFRRLLVRLGCRMKDKSKNAARNRREKENGK